MGSGRTEVSPRVVTPLDSGRLPSAASRALSRRCQSSPRARCQSQVISISGPPMRSAAALGIHPRFRAAPRASARRFLCRLRSGRERPCWSCEHGRKPSGLRLPGGPGHPRAFRRGPGGCRRVGALRWTPLVVRSFVCLRAFVSCARQLKATATPHGGARA